MAKKMKKAAKKAKLKVVGRKVDQPAGKVDSFKAVRAGSARARVVELANSGEYSIEQIASKIGKKRGDVFVHLSCLRRDCGIGYSVSDTGKVKLSFPGSKTVRDAISQKKAA